MRKYAWFLAIIVLSVCCGALGQQDPSVDAGFTRYGAFEGSGVDSVNLANGNVMVHVPIASYPQRGGQLKFNITARFNNINWTVKSHTNPLNPNVVTYYWYLPPQSAGVHVVLDEAVQALQLMDQTGSLPWGVEGIQVTSPDGSTHVLEPTSSTYLSASGQVYLGDWRSIDATGYKFHYSTGTSDPSYGETAQGLKTIFASSGEILQDPNGNQITYSTSTGTWTDTMGRQFTTASAGGLTVNANNILGEPIGSLVVPGMFSGTSTTNYTGCVGSPSSASTLSLPGYGSSSTTVQIKLCYQTYNLTSNMGGTYVNYLGNTEPISESTAAISLLHSIYLPDGTSWIFDYDGRGDLSQITYPTGGTISYTYDTAGNIYDGGYIYATSRAVNDGTGTYTWSYNGCTNNPGSSGTCVVTDPKGNDTAHLFGTACLGSITIADWLEIETDFYSGSKSAGNLLRKITKNYSGIKDPFAGYSPSFPGCMNVVLTGTQTTLSDVGKVSQSTTTYDSATGTSIYAWSQTGAATAYPLTFGLPVSTTESDYGSGSPGATIRSNTTTYEWQTSSNFLTNNLLSRVATSQIHDPSGNLCSETDMNYDQTTPASSGITKQHVTVSGSRGNLSTSTRLLSTTPCQSGASWSPVSTTTAVYDTGVPYQVTDPGGHTTTFAYSSTYYGAYVTQTTLPSTSNSSGTFTHTTSGAYDFNTGLVTSYIDQNGKTSTFTYDDMNRMLTAVTPDTDASGDHGETDFYYPNAVTVERKQRLQNSVWTDEYVQLDGLARQSRTMINNAQSGNGWNQNDTCFDSLGRVSFKSYSYQGTGFGLSKVCSGGGDSFGYDALGRGTTVTHSDGSVATTSYAGAAADSVSEGNGTTTLERITQVDALGRLLSVCEVSSATLSGTSGTPSACGQDVSKTGFLTTYSYDSLGNLRSTSQNGLATRSFTYDSLNRLLSASNPESGTTTYSWNVDGEIISRTRPLANSPGSSSTTTTTYSYDQLHRTLSKSYSDGTTPTANYVYDGGTWLGLAVSSGIGHVVYSYTGTSATSPRTADVNYSFDPVGRMLKTRQCLPASCPTTLYEQDYAYDLLGGILTATDGVGDTMTWTYSAFAATTEVQASFSSQPLISGIQYGPFGMTNATMGNGHAEIDGYDTRGRLASITYNNSSNQPVYYASMNRAADSSLTSTVDSVNGTWSYHYDGFNRLTSATASTGTYSGMTLSWTYDRYGNRLTQSASGSNSSLVTQDTYSFASNQITGFCYDSAGNLLDEVSCASAGSNHQYQYDAEGRLIGTTGYVYEYDAEGNRRSKDNSSGTPSTLYLHDSGGRQVVELNASLVVQHVNVYSGSRLVGTWNPATSKTYYAYSDWLGTKRYEADNTGAYSNSWSGLPFGDSLAPQGTGLDATEHHFTGKEHDSESGLDYFGARYYQSQTGRWLLPDWSEAPIPVPYATFNNPQSLNLYTYVGNNPVNAVDADGHTSQPNNSNVTNIIPGSTWAQHMLFCGFQTNNEVGCLESSNGIMDDAVPPGGNEEWAVYLQQVADSQQSKNQQAQQQDKLNGATSGGSTGQANNDPIPDHFVIDYSRTENHGSYSIFNYALENAEGQILTGNGYSVEEHVDLLWDYGLQIEKGTSNGQFFSIDGYGGYIGDNVGISISNGTSTPTPVTYGSSVYMNASVTQWFTVGYKGTNYDLTTKFGHNTSIVAGQVTNKVWDIIP